MILPYKIHYIGRMDAEGYFKIVAQHLSDPRLAGAVISFDAVKVKEVEQDSMGIEYSFSFIWTDEKVKTVTEEELEIFKDASRELLSLILTDILHACEMGMDVDEYLQAANADINV